mgnify:CR=1 FL=1
MKQKLVFLDIDGTLTPAGTNTPPPGAMAAIRKKNSGNILEILLVEMFEISA